MKYMDFRVGNYISVTEKARKEFFKHTTEILDVRLEVSTISKDEIRILHDGDEVEFNYNQIIPFKINTEWLSAYGFINTPTHYKKLVNSKFFAIAKSNNKLFYNDLQIQPEIKYIHQLQNLYFALTSEELTL